jgi:hypothetical protein
MSISEKQRLALNDFSSKQYELNPGAQQSGKHSVLSGSDESVKLGDLISDLSSDLSLDNFINKPLLVTPTGAAIGVMNGGGQYVAYGSSGALATSYDGQTWTPRISGFAATTIKNVIFDGLRYIAVGGGSSSGKISTSPDGAIWTPRTTGVSTTINLVVSNGSTIIAAGGVFGAAGAVISSTDGGSTWNSIVSNIPGFSSSTQLVPTHISWNSSTSKFVFTWTAGTTAFPYSAYSSDGVSWTFSSSPGWGSSTINGIASSGTTLVAVGDGPAIYSTTSGTSWISNNIVSPPISATTISSFSGVKWLNNNFVAFGTMGLIATSSDGFNWDVRNSGVTSNLLAADYGASNYVIGGASGIILNSSNLSTWTPVNSNITGGSNINDIKYAGGLFVAASIAGKICTSSDGVSWTPQTSNANHLDFTQIAYGNNTYVVIGYNSTGSATTTCGVSSTNGTSWTPRATYGSIQSSVTRANKVAFGNGVFLIAANRSSVVDIRYSTDAVSWTATATNAAASFTTCRALDYVGSLFLIGDAQSIYYTSNATITSWSLASMAHAITTSFFGYNSNFGYAVGTTGQGAGQSGIQTSATGSIFASLYPQVPSATGTVAKGSVENGKNFLIGANGRIISSNDSIKWQSNISNISNTITVNDLIYGNQTYVAVANNGELVSSTNGTTWTVRSSGFSTTNINKIAYNSSLTLFAAVGANNRISTSPDGTSWTSQTSNFNGGDLIGVANSTTTNIGFVTVGNQSSIGFASSSTNGTTWTVSPLQFGTNTFHSATYGNGLYVVGGASGCMVTSTDLTNWTNRNSKFGVNSIRQIIYANGIFVAVGDAGSISSSPDGVTWTSQTSQFDTDNIVGILYANNIFVAYGANGKISTSTNGATWTARDGKFGAVAINSMIYDRNLFVAAGNSGMLSTSPNGIDWTACTVNLLTNNLHALASGNGLYVVGGANACLATSSDGVTWTSQISNISTTITNIAYGNNTFVLKGSGNSNSQVAFSTDGQNWNLFTNMFSVTVQNGELICAGNNFLLAATLGIYSSVDGIEWISRIATGSFSKISYANNVLFVFGSATNAVYIASA